MYGTYYKRNKKTKSKLFSSFVPIVFLLIIGGFVGGTLIKNSTSKTPENTLNQNTTQNILANEVSQGENKEENANNETTDGTNQNNEGNTNSNEQSSSNQDNVTNNDPSGKPVTFDSSVAFIGDSRTQGLIMYNGLKNVQDYSYIGLMVDTAITKNLFKLVMEKKLLYYKT